MDIGRRKRGIEAAHSRPKRRRDGRGTRAAFASRPSSRARRPGRAARTASARLGIQLHVSNVAGHADHRSRASGRAAPVDPLANRIARRATAGARATGSPRPRVRRPRRRFSEGPTRHDGNAHGLEKAWRDAPPSGLHETARRCRGRAIFRRDAVAEAELPEGIGRRCAALVTPGTPRTLSSTSR